MITMVQMIKGQALFADVENPLTVTDFLLFLDEVSRLQDEIPRLSILIEFEDMPAEGVASELLALAKRQSTFPFVDRIAFVGIAQCHALTLAFAKPLNQAQSQHYLKRERRKALQWICNVVE